ncbi:hypothetical protein Acr_03g0011470 [Actinidia rufa]|uniref:Uncharacterized protein n=1 Tax=Actinidia rufa TaxID=165716 RepID=A0A7J0ED23_9ERIC|nr:hypothetical protein Acr_03g0011470 [Actinidia rufa]
MTTISRTKSSLVGVKSKQIEPRRCQIGTPKRSQPEREGLSESGKGQRSFVGVRRGADLSRRSLLSAGQRLGLLPPRSGSLSLSHTESLENAFLTRLGRVFVTLLRKKCRFAVLGEIRYPYARFLQLRLCAQGRRDEATMTCKSDVLCSPPRWVVQGTSVKRCRHFGLEVHSLRWEVELPVDEGKLAETKEREKRGREEKSQRVGGGWHC